MKKVFLWITFIIFSGTVGAQGFTKDMEEKVFPSWWGEQTKKIDNDGNYVDDQEVIDALSNIEDAEGEILKSRNEILLKKEEIDATFKECMEVSKEKKLWKLFKYKVTEDLEKKERKCLGLPEDDLELTDEDETILQPIDEDEDPNVYADRINTLKDEIEVLETKIRTLETNKTDALNAIRTKDITKGKGIQIAGVIGRNQDQKAIIHYIPRLIDILLKFIAPVVMAMFVYSGIRLVYASGNEEDTEKSKEFFIYALLGVLFIVVSYSLMKALYFLLAT